MDLSMVNFTMKTINQLWYESYLHSRHFRFQRWLAWIISIRRCGICYTKLYLQPHHLSYAVLGKWYEFLFLRYVCSKHHKNVQFFFGMMLNKTLQLHLYYYFYKVSYLLTIGVVKLLFSMGKWIAKSYWITLRTPGVAHRFHQHSTNKPW